MPKLLLRGFTPTLKPMQFPIAKLLFFFLFFNNFLSAQSFNAPSVATPNAAAIAKFIDIPVSYHTGVPNIGIPIATISEGSLSLPISINYNSSGIKVDELAS